MSRTTHCSEHLVQRVHTRSCKRIFRDVFDQPGAHGVLQDVSGHAQRRRVVSQDVLEAVPLPQTIAELLGVMESRELLGTGDEAEAFGGVSAAFDQQVHVIRHKAVRKDYEFFLRRRSIKLQQNEIDRRSAREHVAPRSRAEGQEVPV